MSKKINKSKLYKQWSNHLQNSKPSELITFIKTHGESSLLFVRRKSQLFGNLGLNKDSRINVSQPFLPLSYCLLNKLKKKMKILLKYNKLLSEIDINESIRICSKYGYVKVLKILLNIIEINGKLKINIGEYKNNVFKSFWGNLTFGKSGGLDRINRKLYEFLKALAIDSGINNKTAFEIACYYGKDEIVKVFLELDENYKIDPSKNNNYPIRYAAKNGHLKVVELLLESEKVNPAAYRNYAIRWACKNGHLKIVEVLLNYKGNDIVDPIDNIPYIVKDGKSLLSKAIDNDSLSKARIEHLEMVEIIKDCKYFKYDENIPFGKDPFKNKIFFDKYNAVEHCIKEGHTEIFQILLIDSRVNSLNSYNSYVKIAAENGRIEIFKILVEKYNIDLTFDDNLIIKNVVKNGYDEILKFIIKKNVNLSSSDELIQLAIENGHTNIVNIFNDECEKVI